MSDHRNEQQRLDDLLHGADPLRNLASDRQLMQSDESAQALEVLTKQSGPFQRMQARDPRWGSARSGQANRFRFVAVVAVLGLLGFVVVTQTSQVTSAPSASPRTDAATTVVIEPATTESSTTQVLQVDPPRPSTTERPADIPSVPEPQDEDRTSTEVQTESSTTMSTTVPTAEEERACIGEGPTVLKARDDYSKRCDLPRVDCDQFGSIWRCSSEQFGQRPGAHNSNETP